MSFKTYYLNLPVNERESLAQQAGTTRGTLNQVVYAGKQIELGLADCLVALCPGLTLDDMPLTERSRQQRAVRSGAPTVHTDPTLQPALDEAGREGLIEHSSFVHRADDCNGNAELEATKAGKGA